MKRTATIALHGLRCWAVEEIVAVSKGRCERWHALLAQERQCNPPDAGIATPQT